LRGSFSDVGFMWTYASEHDILAKMVYTN